MADRETIGVYDARVAEYAGHTGRKSPDPTLMAFIGRIEPGGLVLDLGCGPADSSVIMRDHGLRVDPVDGSEEMVRWANDTHGIGARHLTFDALDAVNRYQGVWANFSLLHAAAEDLPRHLGAIHRALLPKGLLHIGMKLGEGSRRDSLGRYYSFYSREALLDHLADAGFAADTTDTGESRGLAGDVEPWITISAVAN
ncbi:MAG: class I SAM-dependent methyltransferase [Alphaproteobacteria bacterium]|nr:class I SAM-dependent methyltransferase [Alphaproteobacteria bacterium]